MHNTVERIVIHQSGKVGSSTLQATIEASAPDIRVAKSHFLTPAYIRFFERVIALEDTPQSMRDNLRHNIGMAGDSLAALGEGEGGDRSGLCVLAGFRDPMDFAVSAFFQNLHFYHPELTFAPEVEEAELGVVADTFTKLFEAVAGNPSTASTPETDWGGFRTTFGAWLLKGSSIHWYDEEFLPLHGVDIFARDFSGRPYASVDKDGARYVFYRFEDFGENLEAILAEAGVERMVLENRNMHYEKPYARLAKAFRTSFRPSPEMWSFFYESRFFHHLYGGREPVYGRP